LKSSIGSAGCPAYELTINLQGDVSYSVEGLVPTTRTWRGAVDKTVAAALLREISTSGFLDLPPRMELKGVPASTPWAEIYIALSGSRKAVRFNYHGRVPEEPRRIMQRILAVVSADRWLCTCQLWPQECTAANPEMSPQ
jgi:hypothetical protein